MSDGTPIIIKKKKAHGGHGHHGGSWKVAYADFVTAMMAFFMVMWIMGLSDDTKIKIQGYFNDPLGFTKNQPKVKDVVVPKVAGSNRQLKTGETNGRGVLNSQEQAKDLSRFESIQKKIEAQVKSDASLAKLLKGVEIKITDEGLRIEMVESKDAAFFQSGSAILNPGALNFIKDLAPLLQSTGRKMIIEGHTDAVPYPSKSYTNWDLSSDRANEVRRQLCARGLDEHQLLGVRALADTQLKYPDKPFDPRNRRVSILLPYRQASPGKSVLPKDEMLDKTSPPKISPQVTDY